MAVGHKEQGPVALAIDRTKEPPGFIGGQEFDGGQASSFGGRGHGSGLPPAHELKHGDDDVAGNYHLLGV